MKKDDKREVKQYLNVMYKSAIIMFGSITLWFFIGVWIGKKVGQEGLGSMIGTGVGLVIGFMGLYQQLKTLK